LPEPATARLSPALLRLMAAKRETIRREVGSWQDGQSVGALALANGRSVSNVNRQSSQ
jgi:hypothetical protein